MNINDLTIGQLKEINSLISVPAQPCCIDSGMVGKYVIVRCRDAGVHAGILESYNGRECVLNKSRRLYYWKSKQSAFLSGVATYGLDDCSKVGAPVEIHLTENCEIIECTNVAMKSISGIAEYEPS